MAKGKISGDRFFCRHPDAGNVDGCRTLRNLGSPGKVRAHRIRVHGDSVRKDKPKTEKGLPSKPKMRKVRSKPTDFRRKLLKVLPDAAIIEEVAERFGRVR
jgi:hypothetical protein